MNRWLTPAMDHRDKLAVMLRPSWPYAQPNRLGNDDVVVPPATLSATVDGVPTSLDGLTVPNGSLVEFDVSQPASISWGSSGVIVDNEVKTSTSWQGVVKNGLSSGTAQFTFSADVVAAPPQGFGVTFTVAP